MPLSLDIRSNGFSVVPGVLVGEEVAAAINCIERRVPSASGGIGAAGLRNLTDLVPETFQVLDCPGLAGPVVDVLGARARLVRAILFDKSPAKNWNVLWHQDLFVATRERIDVDGFSSWTLKDGVPHALPPITVLQDMLIARIHLDDCGSDNGPLIVIPGTHALGKLDDAARGDAIANGVHVECVGPAGSVVFMRPLLLHCSRQATSPRRRRVLHLEFAAHELPQGVQWHLDVALDGRRAASEA